MQLHDLPMTYSMLTTSKPLFLTLTSRFQWLTRHPPETLHKYFTMNMSKIICIIVQFSHSVVSDSPWTAPYQASLSITNSRSLFKLISIKSVMPPNHLILCCPLLLSSSIFPSIRVFPNESVLRIRWPKYWSFSFSIILSNEYSGLISFWLNWLDLLVVHGTLKGLLQHHSSKASILWHSVFFMSNSHTHTRLLEKP